MKKKALMLAVLSTGLLFSCGGGSSGTDNETTEHGGGGNNLGAQFVNVSGQLTSQTATGFSAQACSVSVNGKTPAYVVAVTVDQNGRVNAAGSSIDPSCNFSLKLNKAYAYAFALFDSNYKPIAVFIYNNGKALKFSGDVYISAIAKDTNNDGTPDSVEVSVDNPGNVQIASENIPDPTDPNNAGTYDRNNNGTPDMMEDHDRNGKPDCMEDKNGNGHPDSLEDWDRNGIPEGFEDENGDGIPDHVEDSDHNGHPEYHDCNRDGMWEDEQNEGYEGEEGYKCSSQGGGNMGGGNTGGGNMGGGGSTTVSFAKDVYPILKGKCADCHGSNGNFRVGADASTTYTNLMNTTPATPGYTSFINTSNPPQSLLLLKATNSIPHGGGQIFSTTSPEYKTILRWIQSGAPNN